MSKSKNKQKTKPKYKGAEQHNLKGTLDITRSGMGYVVVADSAGDVLVRPGDFNNALHGDTVRVKITKENISTGKKEGRITEVVSRKTNRIYWHDTDRNQFCFLYS